MNHLNGKVALVTGASQGIGASTAKSLIQAGAKVIGIAKSQERLTRFAESLGDKRSQFYPIVCDLSQSDQIVNAFETIESEFETIHILVNNAGILFNSFMIDSDIEKFKTILDVNVLAYAICINKTVKIMRNTNVHGHIININSVCGRYAEAVKSPSHLYCASKYAITGLATVLRNELNVVNAKIKVTNITPGVVATKMMLDCGLPIRLLDTIPFLNAEDVADTIMFALNTRDHVQINEITITHIDKPTGV